MLKQEESQRCAVTHPIFKEAQVDQIIIDVEPVKLLGHISGRHWLAGTLLLGGFEEGGRCSVAVVE